MSFVLASASPRRLELLEQIGRLPAEVLPADIDETPRKGEKPRQYVERMAREKSLAIDHMLPVLAADTSVICGRRILGKPSDRADAKRMLMMLMGRRHVVISAVALRLGEQVFVRSVETKIKMKSLEPRQLDAYLDTNEWEGKAGAYAIQGRAGAFIPWISGSYSNVVGLPLCQTASLLDRIK